MTADQAQDWYAAGSAAANSGGTLEQCTDDPDGCVWWTRGFRAAWLERALRAEVARLQVAGYVCIPQRGSKAVFLREDSALRYAVGVRGTVEPLFRRMPKEAA